jgi:hypothetical protein
MACRIEQQARKGNDVAGTMLNKRCCEHGAVVSVVRRWINAERADQRLQHIEAAFRLQQFVEFRFLKQNRVS